MIKTAIPLEDGVTFQIMSTKEIMEEHEYAGLRFMLDGYLDRMKQPSPGHDTVSFTIKREKSISII